MYDTEKHQQYDYR